MYDRNAVRLALVHMLPAVASTLGARVEPLLQGAVIVGPSFPADHAVVARAQVCALLRGLARASGEALVGFRLGPAAEAERLGLSGAALFAGATLRDCLALHARHMPDLQRGVGLEIVERGRQAHRIHKIDDSDPETAAHLTEGVAAFMVATVRAILGEPEARLLVTFPHRPLAPMARYEDALRCAVAFRSGRDLVIAFDAALLDRRNTRGPGPVILPPDAACDETRWPAAAAMDDDALVAALQTIIGVAALEGQPALGQAAIVLGLSPRSLQRRLSGMGTSWAALVDQWRRQTAATMLGNPATRIGNVARRLGYSDPAHFDRAFRRWTGTSPTAFRAMSAESPPAPG